MGLVSSVDEDLVRVFSVTKADTMRLGLPVFVVTTTLVARPTECLQLQTLNAFAASLCLRAKETERPIAVRWERTRFGNTLRSAHFLKAEAVA